jgi:hypothetical protein
VLFDFFMKGKRSATDLSVAPLVGLHFLTHLLRHLLGHWGHLLGGFLGWHFASHHLFAVFGHFAVFHNGECSPFHAVSPIGSRHLALCNIARMACLESLVPLASVRGATDALLTKANRLHLASRFSDDNVAFLGVVRRLLGLVVSRYTGSSKS